MTFTTRMSIKADAYLLAPLLREADQTELRLSGGKPLESLLMGVKHSSPCFTVLEDGFPVMMFGAVSNIFRLGQGSVWMLSSDVVTRHPKTFMKLGGGWIDLLHTHYPCLSNAVHDQNAVHIRWLKRVGFQFSGTIKGLEGSTFITFERNAHV